MYDVCVYVLCMYDVCMYEARENIMNPASRIGIRRLNAKYKKNLPVEFVVQDLLVFVEEESRNCLGGACHCLS